MDKIIGAVFTGLVLVFALGALQALILMLIGGALLSSFGHSTISFWQSWGIMIVAGLLFKDSNVNK